MLEYDNVHIYPEKTAGSYDNRRTSILSVFVFADGGTGVGIHTTVHILGRVSGRYRQPAPDSHGSRTDCQLSIICLHLNLPLNLALTLTLTLVVPKKTPLAYQSFHFLKLSNQTAHEIILCDTLYNRLCTNAKIHLPKLNFRAEYNACRFVSYSVY